MFCVRSIRLALLILLPFQTAVCAGAPSEIKFGIFSSETPETLKPVWEPFLAALSAAAGVRAGAQFAPSYRALVDAMARNEVQVAWMGNKAALEAVGRANTEVFGHISRKDGETVYYSQLIVRADSPLQTLADVLKCDHSLVLGLDDPNSTSRYLAPATYIFATENIDPKTCFKAIETAKRAELAIGAAAGKFGVAAFSSDELYRLAEERPEVHKQIKVIWTSPPLPLDPILWRKDLDPSLKIKLLKFFLGYGRLGTAEENTAARAVLSKLHWAPFYPSSNRQLLTVELLDATRKLVEAKGADKAAAIIEVAAIAEKSSKAAIDPAQRVADAFEAAEHAGNKAEMVGIVESFAAAYTPTR